MCKPIHIILCVSWITLTMSGCFGIATFLPAECENDIHENKAYYLRHLGKPDMIKATSDDMEIWMYEKKHVWCGVMPAFFLPLPIMLPICDNFERIEFQGDYAKNTHIRRNIENYYYVFLYDLMFQRDDNCYFSTNVKYDTVKPDAQAHP